MGSVVLHTASVLTIAIEMLGLGAVFYLATFIRYAADDFCEITLLRGGPVWSVIFESYMEGSHRSANRFAKLLIVDLSELLGRHDVQLLPMVMILLWLLGLIWILYEIKKMIGFQHPLVVDLFLATTLVFFSILQAPNLFQIFFWRSSSMTHFGPVILFLILAGFILFQVRSANGNPLPLWVPVVVFLYSFIVGGAGETPTLLMVAVFVLVLLYFWRYPGVERRPGRILAFSALMGTFLALCAMFLAPANFSHGETSLLIVPTAIARSVEFTFEFIWDTLLTLPLPSLASAILPALLFMGLSSAHGQPPLLPSQRRRLEIALTLLPLIGCLLIAATFLPSAYGQSFPVERARFSGRFVMTAAFVFEGALIGVWISQRKLFLSFRHLIFPITSVLLLVTAFYPIRGGLWFLKQADVYRAWSSAWDARNEYIVQEVAQGVTDLRLDSIDSIAGIGELKINPKAWLNRCVANYYGLDSIRIH